MKHIGVRRSKTVFNKIHVCNVLWWFQSKRDFKHLSLVVLLAVWEGWRPLPVWAMYRGLNSAMFLRACRFLSRHCACVGLFIDQQEAIDFYWYMLASVITCMFNALQFPVVITRSSNVYGPHQYPEKVS